MAKPSFDDLYVAARGGLYGELVALYCDQCGQQITPPRRSVNLADMLDSAAEHRTIHAARDERAEARLPDWPIRVSEDR
jgi:hypothetical protein